MKKQVAAGRTRLNCSWPTLVLGCLFWAFCLWLAARVPYTHDDWDWGLPVGMRQLLTASLNSRYAGNLLEVLLTRSSAAKTAVMGTTFCLLPAVWTRFAAGRREEGEALFLRPALFCVGAALLLTVRAPIWQQTCGWVAGFSNFVFSALTAGLVLLASSSLFDGPERGRCGVLRALGLFALSAAAQLFLENLAVFLAGEALVFFLADWVRRRRPSLRFAALLLGAAAGAAVMFSSSIYATLLSTGTAVHGYRKLTFDPDAGLPAILRSFWERFDQKIMANLWEDNRILTAAILTAMLLVLVRRRRDLPRWLAGLLLLCHLGFMGLLGAGWTLELSGRALRLFHLAAGGGLFLLVALETALALHRTPRLACKLLWLWVSAPLVLLPLVAVSTLGPRLFFTSDAFLSLFCLAALREGLRDVRPAASGVVAAAAAAAVCVLCIRWAGIYAAIGAVTDRRMDLIRQTADSGAQEVTLPAYPYGQYLWMPDPANEKRVGFFKEFYGIPQSVTVNFASKEGPGK